MTNIDEDTVLGLSAALDAADEPTFWEPWVPKVGDRVRVQWRSDCGDTGRSHAQHVYDRTGIVSYILPAGPSSSKHDVCVEYDKPVIVHVLDGIVTALVVAPYRRDELIPLDTPSPDEPRAGGER